MNLLKETMAEMEEHGHRTGDVLFVYSNTDIWGKGEPQWCTWDEFASRADFNYDEGFGGEVISELLKVVGIDWWLERHDYDGSEWWEHKTLPTKPETHNPSIRIRRYDEDLD